MGEYTAADMIPMIYLHFAIVIVPVLAIKAYKIWFRAKSPTLNLEERDYYQEAA